MVNLVSGCYDKLFLMKKVSGLSRGIPQDHDNKISRSSANFTIDRTLLKFTNHLKVEHTYKHKYITGISSSGFSPVL